MNYTSEDYEKIGRAVVTRLRDATRRPHETFPMPKGDFVRQRADNSWEINIGALSYCTGCGLETRGNVENGKLIVGFVEDPLHLLDHIP